MDINSLLSPQDVPPRETPLPGSSSPLTSTRKPRATRAKSSSLLQRAGSSPLSKSSMSSASLPQNNGYQARPQMRSGSLQSSSSSFGTVSINTPPTETPSQRYDRQSSTSGMDTLADLASMQHHQQEARTNASGLRSAEVYETQRSPAIRPSLQGVSRTPSVPRGSFDLSMADAPVPIPSPRTYTASSLSEAELQRVAQLVSYLAENPYAYEQHVQLVKLLHQGFMAHVYPNNTTTHQNDPHSYELLQDLRQATEAMDSRFGLGEDLWTDRLQDQQLLANGLEDCITVAELYKKAIQEEAGSTKLWISYSNWMLTLYNTAYGEAMVVDDGDEALSYARGWTEEDKLVAREVFGRQQVMDVLQQGTEETMYRIQDGQTLWERYTRLLLQDLAQSPSTETITTMKNHFMKRLRIPSAAWDSASQMFSTFMSTYDDTAYEETMIFANQQGSDAKAKYAAREFYEMKLQRAVEAGDVNTEWSSYTEYLEWELNQHRKRKIFDFQLANALFQRANIRFPTDTNFWEDSITFLVQEAPDRQRYDLLLPLMERATRHCPWSGTLWAQYIVAAESGNLEFTAIGHIKHKATATGLLDAGGMEEVLKVHSAWCGFLRRRAFLDSSTDEDADVAEVGIRSAIEDMDQLGRKKYDKEYKGDPQFRLERIYIKYLSQVRNFNGARDTWKSLTPRHGDSYEFWLRYYNWEMIIWAKLMNDPSAMQNPIPSEATKVLGQAVRRPNLDWPEKIVEAYLRHCEEHESSTEFQGALAQTRKVLKTVEKRRAEEAAEASVAAQAQPEAQAESSAQVNGKRKRDSIDDTEHTSPVKKSRPEDAEKSTTQSETQTDLATSAPKRDRENATVVVNNIPLETTETRVRQFFRDCGTINSLKLLPDENGYTLTATIEFDSREDVLTAQTKDLKDFDGNSIQVQVGSGSTVYVTNFLPTADEAYIRGLFEKYGEIVEIRLPSLKYNTHRRFCYVQFRSPSEARAATELDGTEQEGLKLLAKLSDPAHKQERKGAVHEGRELYVANLDWSATEDEVKTVFSKYGKVEKVRIPRKLDGGSKGMGFVVFSNKEEAESALDLNLTKFKSRLLNVSMSVPNPAKRAATTVITSVPRASTSASPQPEARADSPPTNGVGDHASDARSVKSTSAGPSHPSREEIASRTIALMNIPDTVNDARIRALVEPCGELVKIILRHDHQGAIVEFKDVASTGKASMELEGVEIAPGRKISVGTVKEMFHEKAEYRNDKIGGKPKKEKGNEKKEEKAGASSSLQPAMVRRPGLGAGRKGGRGGLGVKRFIAASKDESSKDEAGDTKMNGTDEATEEVKPKSNADFKAMFVGSESKVDAK